MHHLAYLDYFNFIPHFKILISLTFFNLIVGRACAASLFISVYPWPLYTLVTITVHILLMKVLNLWPLDKPRWSPYVIGTKLSKIEEILIRFVLSAWAQLFTFLVFGFSRKPCVFTRRQAACLHAAYLQNSFWRSRKQTKVTCWVYMRSAYGWPLTKQIWVSLRLTTYIQLLFYVIWTWKKQ